MMTEIWFNADQTKYEIAVFSVHIWFNIYQSMHGISDFSLYHSLNKKNCLLQKDYFLRKKRIHTHCHVNLHEPVLDIFFKHKTHLSDYQASVLKRPQMVA